MYSAVNMLTNSPNILDLTKADFSSLIYARFMEK